jgi:hypothetical protein
MSDLFSEQTGAYVDSGANISACGKYRYKLWREWRGVATKEHWRWFGFKDGAGQEVSEPKACLFIMFNPSTADGKIDDPTIRRCVSFAKREKYDRLEVVNLFAWRATDPGIIGSLTGKGDPIGPANQDAVTDTALVAGLIVCAWGVEGSLIGQDETVLGWLGDRRRYALGLTKDGHPRHPLYLPKDAPLIPFDGVGR